MPVTGDGKSNAPTRKGGEPGYRRGWHGGCIVRGAMIEILAAIIQPPQVGASTELPSSEAPAGFAGLLAGLLLPPGIAPSSGPGAAPTIGFAGPSTTGPGGASAVGGRSRSELPAGTGAATSVLFGGGEAGTSGIPLAAGGSGSPADAVAEPASTVPAVAAAAGGPLASLRQSWSAQDEPGVPPVPGGAPPAPSAGVPISASFPVAGEDAAAAVSGAAPPSPAGEGVEVVGPAVARTADPLRPGGGATTGAAMVTAGSAEGASGSVGVAPRAPTLGDGETASERAGVPADRAPRERAGFGGKEGSRERMEGPRDGPGGTRPIVVPGGAGAVEPRSGSAAETAPGPSPAAAAMSFPASTAKPAQPFFAADLSVGGRDPDPTPGPAVASDPAAGVAAASNRAAAEVPGPPAPPARTLPVAQLGLFVVRAATQQISHFVVRLEPASLGRVEITLRFKDDGRVAASFRAQQGDALQMLRAEAPAFARLFADHGIELAPGGFDFGMMGGDGGADREWPEAFFAAAGDEEGAMPAAGLGTPVPPAAVGLLDLTV